MLCNDSHFTLTYQEHRVQRPFVKINQFVRAVEVRAVVKNLFSSRVWTIRLQSPMFIGFMLLLLQLFEHSSCGFMKIFHIIESFSEIPERCFLWRA
jgi:hypothetical protein